MSRHNGARLVGIGRNRCSHRPLTDVRAPGPSLTVSANPLSDSSAAGASHKDGSASNDVEMQDDVLRETITRKECSVSEGTSTIQIDMRHQQIRRRDQK